MSHLDKPRWLGRFGRLDLDSASEVGQCKHSYGVLLKVAKVVHGNLWFDLCGLPQAGPLEGRSQRAFSPPLHDVLEVRYGLRERLAQERRAQIDLSEACKLEPPELEPSVAFNADVRLRGIKEPRACGEAGLEVEADLVILLASIFEEVLDHVGQRSANHVLFKFLSHLANHGLGGVFARLDSATRKRPEAVFLQAMQ